MKFKPHFLLALFLMGCVSQHSPNSKTDFDTQQAAKARVELALGYLSQQNFPQAKQNLDKALSYAPHYYLVHSALAYFYQQQGDVQQARDAYLKAIQLDKTQGDTYNNFGTFLCLQGEFEQAYQQFDLALSSPNYYQQADTYENKAICALSANHQDIYQQSKTALEKIEPVRVKGLEAQK